MSDEAMLMTSDDAGQLAASSDVEALHADLSATLSETPGGSPSRRPQK